VRRGAGRCVWLAGVVALAWACGGISSSDSGSICAPGETQSCAGPRDCQGAQICNDEGSGWGACDCGDGTGGSAGTPGVRGSAAGSTGGAISIGPLGGAGGTGGMDGTGGIPIPPYGPVCSDGWVNQPGEECDDGNTYPGDGCNGMCQVEPNWECPPEGGPCVAPVLCGDGQIGAGEVCDDGNVLPGDGCAADCSSVEPGYACPTPGLPCIDAGPPSCGDGVVQAPDEDCDDGINDGGYGECAPGCTLGPHCGDGVVQPEYEDCDDGNNASGDDCSASCRIEFVPD
jgi:cysteine-rich repeat protein